VVVLSAARAATAAEGPPLRLGTILPSGTAQHTMLKQLAENWRKEAPGSPRLIIDADGRQGGEAEMVQKMNNGLLGAGLFSVVGLSEIDPGVTGLQLIPMMFRSWAEVDYVREKMRPALEQRLRAKGFGVLFWADAGWVRFFSKKPGLRPDDFRKFDTFVWKGSEEQVAIMRSIGMKPVALETADVKSSLMTGMINCVPLPPIFALPGQIHTNAGHMLELDWCPIVGAAIVKLEVWEKIPPATRTKMQASADAIGQQFRARGRLDHEEAIRTMCDRGLKAHQPTPEVVQEWREFASAVYPRIRGAIVPADIFDAVEQHVRAYRENQKSAGDQ
jgi:TRAP-type C4-dicarboxylate transport system substrate-binding protein